MPDLPYFSIVTPVLNGYTFISRYVTSLKSQTFINWEACIVDDGSSDGSIEAILSLVGDDPRFIIVTNPLQKLISSPYQARNYGLSLVRGQYICFLDIDDYWHPSYLGSLFQLLHSSPVQPFFAYSSYYRVNCSNNSLSKRFSAWPIPPHLLISFINIVPMLTACVSSELIKKHQLSFLPVYHEDYVFWHTLFRIVPSSRLLVSNSFLAFYSMHRDSLSHNKYKALAWLSSCYDYFGYNFFQKLLAFSFRFCFELISRLRSILSSLA